MKLLLADVENLLSFHHRLDKVFSNTSIIFWKEPVERLMSIREKMNKNGVIAITVQPFLKGATDDTAKQLGQKIMNQLKEAGFSEVKLELKFMKPVAAACVLGVHK